MKKFVCSAVVVTFLGVGAAALVCALTGCTFSLSNVDTHGTTSDTADSTPTTDTTATIPLIK